MVDRDFTFLELHIHDTADMAGSRWQQTAQNSDQTDRSDSMDRDDSGRTGRSRKGKLAVVGAMLLLVLVGVMAKRRMGGNGDETDEFETYEETDQYNTFEETTPE